MGRFDLPEQFAVRLARQSVLDSLMSHGELAVVFQAYHASIDKDAERCYCFDDIYKDKSGDGFCTTCYNTSYVGFKQVARSWTLFTDTPSVEEYKKNGVWSEDSREFQTEAFPQIVTGDYIARVSTWNSKTPLVVEGVYVVKDVKSESLRTGIQYGQAYYDVIGQRGHISRLHDSHPIYSYPLKGTIERPREYVSHPH